MGCLGSPQCQRVDEQRTTHNTLLAFCLSNRFLYYALDFMNGGDLFRHWRKHRNRRADMAPFYASEVLLALEHLHKHCVIYRDLKPEN
ncbi:unnamed protein product, partial [Scytosiphon promiscuus]